MKKNVLLMALLILTAGLTFAQSPLSMNGRLKLVGNQLSNECGDPVQLRGMSTHGVMFHQECYTASSVKALAEDWGSDFIRLAIYTEASGGTPGYIGGDRTFWNSWIDDMVTLAESNGMYVIIDWHILADGNPNTHIAEAKTFFALMSSRYKDKKNVLYEICNEPNGTNWGTIKQYAEQIIPIIRANDPEGIILVGTPDWSSKVWDAANNPLTGANAHNVMYTFHFYAGSHYDYDYLRTVLAKVPVFVSEWGTTAASGNGGFNSGSANNWISVMNGDNNGGVKVSAANWSFVDKDESASALTPGACLQDNWDSRTQSGDFVYNWIHSPDNFTQCNSAADDDGDGVSNGDDICPGTATGTYVDSKGCPALQGDTDNDGIIDAEDLCANTSSGAAVNIHGCELTDDFVSNVCMGLNNYQGYARTDFTEDSLANLDYWNRPSVGSPVYSASASNGELVIQVTNGDPDYATMGFSFGELYSFNGSTYDTTLLPLDISAHPVLTMDVSFQGTGYSATTVLVDIQLEDVNGNVVTTDKLQNVMRKEVALNTWVTIEADFTDGYRESYDATECGGTTPCYFQDFDFTKVNKVKMWVNPSAGAEWSKPPFNGTWKIDNFSIGYDETSTATCTAIRDDDNDGIKQEEDKCANTPSNASVDANGCAAFQLDDDKDGVVNPDDLCPSTPAGEAVNSRGCAVSEADDDQDGVINTNDLCANTPSGASVDANGCSSTQLDADNDGVPNSSDLCANTPTDETADSKGCSPSQLNADDDNDGILNPSDLCPNTVAGASVNSNGCSNAQLDDDNDGTPNGTDACPNDPNKIAPGNCGCNVAEDACTIDCAGVINGTAYTDNCAQCVGGTTGLEACVGDPYNNTPQTIPGIVEAEKYDLGGQNIGYNDSETSNQGGVFRQDGVDLEACEGSSTNFNVGYTEAGEWLQYAVNVLNTGTYNISFRIASEAGSGSWHLELDGTSISGTSLNSTTTGGWQTYSTVVTSQPISLQKGQHSLRFVIDAGGFNLDRVKFTAETITGLNKVNKANQVSIYPIPATDKLTISQKETAYTKAIIMDVTGNIVKEVNLTRDTEQVSLDKMAKGVYFIRLTGVEQSELFRVLVQ